MCLYSPHELYANTSSTNVIGQKKTSRYVLSSILDQQPVFHGYELRQILIWFSQTQIGQFAEVPQVMFTPNHNNMQPARRSLCQFTSFKKKKWDMFWSRGTEQTLWCRIEEKDQFLVSTGCCKLAEKLEWRPKLCVITDGHVLLYV